ncbi:MAG: formylglycine-generating enzyme family protein, partial [Myxococcales bacterium]|nr:formylglycine-generating enzyme family protein [Myxococcales bacterium]
MSAKSTSMLSLAGQGETYPCDGVGRCRLSGIAALLCMVAVSCVGCGLNPKADYAYATPEERAAAADTTPDATTGGDGADSDTTELDSDTTELDTGAGGDTTINDGSQVDVGGGDGGDGGASQASDTTAADSSAFDVTQLDGAALDAGDASTAEDASSSDAQMDGMGDVGQPACALATQASDCNDNDPCSTDLCKLGVCTHAPSTAPCDDNNACTESDVCAAGVCKGTASDCDDGNVCTDDSCHAQDGCKSLPNQVTCTDGSPCTTGEGCAKGKCTGGKPACPDTTWPCHETTCDEKSGACGAQARKDGAVCGHEKGVCKAGGCVWTDGDREWGLVPAGTFWMGCNPKLDTACAAKPNEKPQHRVTISTPFWMGLTESTVGDYQACVDAKECLAPTEGSGYVDTLCAASASGSNWTTKGAVSGRTKHPMNCINWQRAEALCAWAGGSLPTEAQWELAARGRCEENGGTAGCAAQMRVYPWGNSAPACAKQAVYSSGGKGCGANKTAVVKTGSALGRGPYGQFDLEGNVYEWIRDWHAPSYYAKYAVSKWPSDPVATAPTPSRALRGGSWYDTDTAVLRAGFRAAATPVTHGVNIGVRCVRPASTSCKTLSDGVTCNDGDACTSGDLCKSGVCVGAGKSCDDGNPCTADACAFNVGCIYAPLTECDDGNPCTVKDACKAAKCVGGAAKTCDDKNPCTSDTCDPKAGCQFSNNKLSCIDGDACTSADTCKSGSCKGAAKNCDDG